MGKFTQNKYEKGFDEELQKYTFGLVFDVGQSLVGYRDLC